MQVVLQRVKEASVKVDGEVKACIGKGICLLVGVEKEDSEEDIVYAANKIVDLRIFPDKEGKMNLALMDIEGEVLAVSQFTLAGSIKKGRRPSFDKAEEPGRAASLFDEFVKKIEERGIPVKTGVFGARMDVCLTNDGPVTFVIQSQRGD